MRVSMQRTSAVIQTGAAIVFVAALWPLTIIKAAEPPNPDICKTTNVMTLTGKIRSIQSMREEPQAEVQTFFLLDLSAPLCGTRTVTASMIGPIACSENDTIEITGDYSPPEKMFNTARLRSRQIARCVKH
jgi:hypothetical protein